MATKTNWIVSIPNISSPGSFEEEDFDSLVEAQQFLLQWYGTVRSIPEGLICENTYEVDSEEDEESMNSPHGFSFTAKPDADVPVQVLKDYFDKAGIEWKRNFGSMPTQHKCFEYLNYRLGDFPEAEYVGDNGIHIGVHQMLSQDDLQYVVDTIKKLY